MPDWKAFVSNRLGQRGRRDESGAATVEELAAHLQDRYDDLCAAGMSPEDAAETTAREWADDEWREARHHEPPRVAGLSSLTDSATSGNLLTDLWRDLRYGCRLLCRNPAFAATVVLTLAFGIGANTVAFTVINSLLLTPLPVANPDRLVKVSTRDAAEANDNAQLPLSYPNLQDLQQRTVVFDSLAGYAGPFGVTLTGNSPPRRVFAELITANYFDTLGVKPSMGRFFHPEEDQPASGHAVVILGRAAWEGWFAARPDIIGRTLEINRIAFTVVGVAPAGFKGLDPVFGPDIWIPSAMTSRIVSVDRRQWLTDRAALGFSAVGRLRPGATVTQAESNLAAISTHLAREFPTVNRGRSASVRSLSRHSLMGLSPQLAIVGSVAVLAIPGLILLIACSNVANLLLARATTRGHEFAVRLALGSGRSRIVRQLLTEHIVLGLVSGATGVAAGWAGARFLWSFRPAEYAQNLTDVSFDHNVVLFGLLLSAVTTAIFGTTPALHGSRANLVSALNEGTRSAGQTRRTTRLRRALLVGQVALSLMALVTAGMFLQSLQRGYAIDPGFERRHLGVIMLNPGQAGYDGPRTEQLYRTIGDRVAALPGIASVSFASNLPLFTSASRKVSAAGSTTFGDTEGTLTVVNVVDGNYFATTDVAMTRGRSFVDADRGTSAPVAIINDALARQYWPGRDPVGDQIRFVGDETPRRIVGVAETVNYDEIGERPQGCVYLPLAQNLTDAIVLYVRTEVDPGPALTMVQRELARIDERLDVADARTIEKVLDQALYGATMSGALFGVFGLLALALAGLGMYGVMAHAVHLRQREMGVRMALGAEPTRVVRLVLGDGIRLVVVGVAIGIVGAAGIGTLLSGLLHGVSPLEPMSVGAATLVLAIVGFVASYLPARRASQMDPSSVLRAN
jgi:predicted permease